MGTMQRQYSVVSVPSSIVREIKKRIRRGQLANYRSHSEFIISTVRDRLEQGIPTANNEATHA